MPLVRAKAMDEGFGLIEHAVVSGVSDLRLKAFAFVAIGGEGPAGQNRGRVCDGLPMSVQNLSHKIGTGQILSAIVLSLATVRSSITHSASRQAS